MKQQNNWGIFAAILSFLLWGILPLYWKALRTVAPFEIWAHRIVWAMLFLGLLVHYKNGWGHVAELLKNNRKRNFLLLSTSLVGLNWFLYIWSVNNHHILQASLGYYINPLMNVFLGIYLFNEKLNNRQWMAIILATIAVIYLTYASHVFPGLALLIALSFCLYGAIHKKMNAQAIETLFVETLLLSIPTFGYLLIMKGGVFFTSTFYIQTLLLGAGIVTALPLLLFVYAMNRVRLSTLGFLQYISPTGQFLCGIIALGEKVTNFWLITYAFIWIAVLLYLTSDLKRNQMRFFKKVL